MTTPYIEAKKAEVREKLLARIASSREFNWEGGFQPEFLAVFVEGEFDTLLDEIQEAAVLHDTIEDTETTYEELEGEFGADVAVVVECLTHRKGESYAEYIQRVKANPDAIAVKLADIADNLGDYPSQNAIRKSAMALEELLTPNQ